MRRIVLHRAYCAVAIAILIPGVTIAADNTSDIQTLKSATDLLDAQTARDNAEASAIAAAAALSKARAAAANVADEIQKDEYNQETALTKAKVGAQTAQLEALKTAFGNAPTIGTDGNVTISDSTTGVLLQTKAGSLETTWTFAGDLCAALVKADIKGGFIAPTDLDAKIQSARLVLREFDGLTKRVRDSGNRDLVGLSGAQVQVAPAAILGAVSLLEYGAGALQSVAKLFRSDYGVALSSDASRAAWLEYFMVATCPIQVPRAQIEGVVRNQSMDSALNGLNALQEFYDAAAKAKSATQNQVSQLQARIAELKTRKQETSVFEAQLQQQNQRLASITGLDTWLPRIQALLNTVATSPAAFLDALTWYAFGDDTNPLNLNTSPRITLVMTTQDAQITRTHWLTGKKLYSKSAGEVIYRTQDSAGHVLAAGYLTSRMSSGSISFKATADPSKFERHKVVPKPAVKAPVPAVNPVTAPAGN